MRKSLRVILFGLILIAPILLLILYMLNTSIKETAKDTSNIGKIKLVTPVAIIDEITQKIEEDDIEGALMKINAELPDPNIPSSSGTPLIVLAAEKRDSEIVAALLQKGALPDKADLNTSETALIKAVRNQDFETVSILLTAGANPDLGTNQGITPLGIAIDLKDEPLANQLLSNGATNGVSQEKLFLYAFQKNPVGVSVMLAGGISANITDKDNNTPFIISAANGDLESAKYLFSYRANINAKNKYGMTALLYAIKGKHKEMTDYLINNGAKINSSNIYGQNALFWAAYYGDIQLVHNLLVLGANYNKKTRRGQTALQMARALGHTETVKALEDFIAYKNLPRDSKGNIILPQVNKNAAQAPAATNDDSPTSELVDEMQQIQAQKASEKQAAAQAAQSSQAEMPQMPAGMDMSAVSAMMGGAGGGNVAEMMKKMQSLNGGANNSAPAQIPGVPAGMMPQGANISAEQLKQMGVPEEQIATIMQAQQQASQNTESQETVQENSNGFKPKDLSNMGTNKTGRTNKTQINKLQTSK